MNEKVRRKGRMHFNSDCFFYNEFMLLTRAVPSYFLRRSTVTFLSYAEDYRKRVISSTEWQVSNLNTYLKSTLSKPLLPPPPQVSFISCPVRGWIKTDTGLLLGAFSHQYFTRVFTAEKSDAWTVGHRGNSISQSLQKAWNHAWKKWDISGFQ